MIKDLQKDNNLDDTVNCEGENSSEEGSSGSTKSTGPDDSQTNLCFFI